MFVSILAMLGGAQAIGLSIPVVTAPPHGLIADLSNKSVLRADTAASLKSEEGITRLTSNFVSGFLDKDRLTLAQPTSETPDEAAAATPLAALAAGPLMSRQIGSVAAALKH